MGSSPISPSIPLPLIYIYEKLTWIDSQYQEAQDTQIPIIEGNRPEIQEEPQACVARDNEGFGKFALFLVIESKVLTRAIRKR